jgi:hypothetical protein
MKTQQNNFRLSAQAQSNLKTICDVSGVNQTAAVEMALAALANGLTNRRNAMSKIEITIQHDREGFYGADENHEQPAAEQRYCNMVDAEILKLHPDAKISHEWGQYYSAKVIVHVDDNWDDDDKQNSDIREMVEQIEENIYGRDGSFWHN